MTCLLGHPLEMLGHHLVILLERGRRVSFFGLAWCDATTQALAKTRTTRLGIDDFRGVFRTLSSVERRDERPPHNRQPHRGHVIEMS